MMHFPKARRPRGWQTYVLKAGRAWLKQPGNRNAKRPKDLWSPYRDHLAAEFSQLCGYTAMWTPVGTVDHYVPWVEVRGTRQAHQAYQWENMRYSAEWFNRERKAKSVPDPYTVQNDWFRLLLPSLELVATDQVPAEERSRVNTALYWLGKYHKVIKKRRGFFTAYLSGGMTIEQLDVWAPLIGCALRDNPEFLLPTDRVRFEAGTL